MQLQYESDMYLIGILILIKPASEIESDMILWIQPESINSIQYGAHINLYFIEAVQMDPSHLVLHKKQQQKEEFSETLQLDLIKHIHKIKKNGKEQHEKTHKLK